MIRLVQIACIAVTALILYGIMKGVDGVKHLIGDTFDTGFLVGMIFTLSVYGLICWIDPSSRPRGSATKQDGTR
ncbi:hypothetical protein [Agrobacterium rubi]|uniref:Uncharacterized protein n=1 Tax=Agrobacterium rubi TaxID=28099 RepID=A0ABX2IXU7_9HYPH|nr:hypothetical protein [Agrobacterium rubi]NTF35570.1 hypothetical protein [Agrobacterium rubi]